MGDLLFSIANLARKLGLEPESSLREANEKFTQRFQALEQAFDASGRQLSDASLEEMEEVWRTVKTEERRPSAKARRPKTNARRPRPATSRARP